MTYLMIYINYGGKGAGKSEAMGSKPNELAFMKLSDDRVEESHMRMSSMSM